MIQNKTQTMDVLSQSQRSYTSSTSSSLLLHADRRLRAEIIQGNMLPMKTLSMQTKPVNLPTKTICGMQSNIQQHAMTQLHIRRLQQQMRLFSRPHLRPVHPQPVRPQIPVELHVREPEPNEVLSQELDEENDEDKDEDEEDAEDAEDVEDAVDAVDAVDAEDDEETKAEEFEELEELEVLEEPKQFEDLPVPCSEPRWYSDSVH